MTPREPDRFDAQGLEWMENILSGKWGDVDIAAALRAEHAEARAIALDEAHSIAYEANAEDIADQIEQLGALIPPAAAPAAEPERPCTCGSRDDVHVMTCAKVAWLNSPPTGPFPPPPAPAAEPGKAQGADKIGYCKTCGLDASHGVCNDPRDALLRECEEALIGVKYMVTEKAWVVVNDLLVRLAARAATSEREGT